MSQFKAPFDNHSDAIQIVDPGDAGAIVADRNPMYVPLVSAAAETRTLARPTKVGDIVILFFKTDGGDITLTVTGGFNEAADTTLTFANAGEFAMFVSCYDGTNYLWRQVSNSFIGNASALVQSAALTAADGSTVDTTYGQEEADVISNLVTRQAEIEAALQAAGIIA